MTMRMNRETDRRRSAIITALRAAGPAGISGESLASELGISRVAVSKHIGVMRDLGYDIDSTVGKGYVLRRSPNLPLPFEVYPKLTTEGVALYGGQSTTSTNDDIKHLVMSGGRGRIAVLANHQTGGRGRLGRTWESPEGGLYLSLLLQPKASPVRVVATPLVTGLALVKVMHGLGAETARIKWPNDVLLGEGKLCGVLSEMSTQAECVETIICGIGINVNNPGDAPEGWAYLSDSCGVQNLAELAARVIDGVYEYLLRWQECGYAFAMFRDEYNANLALIGEQVVVREMDGTPIAEGVVDGADEVGRLIVGGVPVLAGDVTLRS